METKPQIQEVQRPPVKEIYTEALNNKIAKTPKWKKIKSYRNYYL